VITQKIGKLKTEEQVRLDDIEARLVVLEGYKAHTKRRVIVNGSGVVLSALILILMILHIVIEF
jgi:hypothetical protein